MLVRTTKVQTHPGQVDELVRRWREIVAPHVPEVPGLRGIYLCGDRDANTVVAIHLWSDLPDRAAHEIHERQRFHDEVRDLLRAKPVVEEYEVLAQA